MSNTIKGLNIEYFNNSRAFCTSLNFLSRFYILVYLLTVVAETEEGTEGLGMSIWDLTEYFYSDNGLVSSTQPERLQREFDVLTCLSGQVSLRKNTQKTVSMDFQPCHTPGRMSMEAY